ncbi:MAG: glycosyltransferase family 1 protein [Patescibacteria group bacterium]
MKIALVNNFPPYSGTGRVPYSLFHQFQNSPELNVNADLYCTHYLESIDLALPENSGVTFLHHFPYKQHENLSRLMIYFVDPLRIPRGYDLYHIGNHMLGNYLYFLKPIVITVHDLLQFKYETEMSTSLSSLIYDKLLRISLNALPRAKKIICVSDWTRREVLKKFGLPEEKAVTIHNGVDHTLYKPGNREEARYRLGLPQDKKILLNVGAETKRKNIPMLLKAAAALLKEGIDFHLIRVGEKTELIGKLINDLGLAQQVTYFGNVKEAQMPDFYRAADLLLMPSLDEGFGFPLLEALSCGLPAVASDVGPLSEIGGTAAFYASPNDLNGWVNNARKILSLSETEKTGLISAGLSQSEKFSWERNAKETAVVYGSIINNGN